jgi:uncharacterized protein (TIGR01777 family)
MKVVVTGATGLLGRALLAEYPDAVVLSRRREEAERALGVPAFAWDPDHALPSLESLAGAKAIFHLAGESVFGRWSEEKKKRIYDSRIKGTRNLVEALAQAEAKPEVLVAASASGIYGDRGDEELTEDSATGDGFLADVCKDWEREANAAEALGIRVVNVRIGVVLAKNGGALKQMLPFFKLGAGGRIGSGQQWMSWIHIEDVIGLLTFAERTKSVRGPLNLVAPEPVTNRDFTRALGHALKRPAVLPLPRIGLRLAFGEVADVITGSQRIYPQKALAQGYVFHYPALAGAFDSLVGRDSARSAA